MIFGNKRRILGLALVICMLFTTEFEVFAADPQSEAQSSTLLNYETVESPLTEVWSEIPQMAEIAEETQEWRGKALANTDTTLDVFAEANGAVIGKMFKNTVVEVLEEGEAWTKISSGKVQGYVKTEGLLFGQAAVERAEVVCAQGTKDAKTLDELKVEQQKCDQVKLLAALIYCEAGNQPYDGKVAVGAVVMNRIKSGRFPNTLEGVIYQRGQFTPAMTGKLARIIASNYIPASCYEAAQDALDGVSPVGGALFFNTRSGSFKLGDHYFS